MTLAEVEWSKLLEAAYVSAAFGIGVILVAGVAVVASLRAQDRRSAHDGRRRRTRRGHDRVRCADRGRDRARHLHHDPEMSDPFDSGRPRPIVTALDMLRRQIDHDDFDAAVFSLDAVAADLGYGDVRALPGAVAWIDRLRAEDKRIALAAAAERAQAALEIAGIADRFDVVVTGSPASARVVARARGSGRTGRPRGRRRRRPRRARRGARRRRRAGDRHRPRGREPGGSPARRGDRGRR